MDHEHRIGQTAATILELLDITPGQGHGRTPRESTGYGETGADGQWQQKSIFL